MINDITGLELLQEEATLRNIKLIIKNDFEFQFDYGNILIYKQEMITMFGTLALFHFSLTQTVKEIFDLVEQRAAILKSPKDEE